MEGSSRLRLFESRLSTPQSLVPLVHLAFQFLERQPAARQGGGSAVRSCASSAKGFFQFGAIHAGTSSPTPLIVASSGSVASRAGRTRGCPRSARPGRLPRPEPLCAAARIDLQRAREPLLQPVADGAQLHAVARFALVQLVQQPVGQILGPLRDPRAPHGGEGFVPALTERFVRQRQGPHPPGDAIVVAHFQGAACPEGCGCSRRSRTASSSCCSRGTRRSARRAPGAPPRRRGRCGSCLLSRRPSR